MKNDSHKTEFEINNMIIEYDACSFRHDVQECIKFYDSFDYIASSYVFYVNGKKQQGSELYHFFKYKSPDNLKLIRKIKLKNIKTT